MHSSSPWRLPPPPSSPPPKEPEQQAAPGVPPPIMPPSQQHREHWLDSFFGLRHWLEDKHRHWWIKGLVEARCKEFHQLHGREPEVRAAIEREYAAAMQRNARLAVDGRAETHLQVAALVLASYKTLQPYLRDERQVLQIVSEHMGGRTQALLRFMLRATKWLHRDGYAVLAARLRGLQWDMGRGFESQLDLGTDESSLSITRCFYADLFGAEGAPQLAAACCCSQDRVWFEAVTYRGVEAGRVSAISAGDARCCFVVRRQRQPGAAAGDAGAT